MSDMRKFIIISEGVDTLGPDQREPETFPISGEFARDERADHKRYGPPEKSKEKHLIATEIAAAWVELERQIIASDSLEKITKLEKKKAKLTRIARDHGIGNILTYIIAARRKN